MSNSLDVNGNRYTFAINYKDNKKFRDSFNALTKKTYGFDFEQWYQDGYWKEQYVPYSLFNGETCVANVSVNLMDFLVEGEKKRYIQLGTVMTDQAYRKQGLSRALMQKVLCNWEDKCDLIYLFANDSALEFYPKFGFVTAEEYQFSKPIVRRENSSIVRKLEMSDVNDRNLLFQTAANTVPFSKIAMQNNAPLVMFYGTSFMKDSVYYIQDSDVVVVADFDNDTLYLNDIFSTHDVSLDQVIDALINEQITKVILGFVPKDSSAYQVNLLKEDDLTLFVKETKENLFQKGRFPVLSHA